MTIRINLDKAKEIKKNIVRDERAPHLAALDTEFIRALETGDTKLQAKITKKKQALRDATKADSILKAKTIEELKKADPVADVMNSAS